MYTRSGGTVSCKENLEMFGNNLHCLGHMLHTDGVYKNTQHFVISLERLRKMTGTIVLHSLLLGSDHFESAVRLSGGWYGQWYVHSYCNIGPSVDNCGKRIY
jgi:hypothetical protein